MPVLGMYHMGKFQESNTNTVGEDIMRNVKLYHSPDEGIWYYQRLSDWKVSVKSYKTKEDAFRDYKNIDSPTYKWIAVK